MTFDRTWILQRAALQFAHLFLGHTGARRDPGGAVHTVH